MSAEEYPVLFGEGFLNVQTFNINNASPNHPYAIIFIVSLHHVLWGIYLQKYYYFHKIYHEQMWATF